MAGKQELEPVYRYTGTCAMYSKSLMQQGRSYHSFIGHHWCIISQFCFKNDSLYHNLYQVVITVVSVIQPLIAVYHVTSAN